MTDILNDFSLSCLHSFTDDAKQKEIGKFFFNKSKHILLKRGFIFAFSINIVSVRLVFV